jgi:hypothetical protein
VVRRGDERRRLAQRLGLALFDGPPDRLGSGPALAWARQKFWLAGAAGVAEWDWAKSVICCFPSPSCGRGLRASK